MRVIADYLPTPCRATCYKNNRRELSALIACATVGAGLKQVRIAQWRAVWRTKAARNGLFIRLADAGVLPPFVDWQHIAAGDYYGRNPFADQRPLQRIVATYRDMIEGERRHRLREIHVAAGGRRERTSNAQPAPR